MPIVIDCIFKCSVNKNKERKKDLEKIKKVSKESFKTVIKKMVNEKALEQLKEECRSLKKTTELDYDSLSTQDYLMQLYPSQSRLVFKWRSETLDIKTHSTHKYNDNICRKCQGGIEDPLHVVNCGREKMEINIDVLKIGVLDDFTKSELKQLVSRISLFLDEVT